MWKLLSLCAGTDITLGISRTIAEELNINEKEIALLEQHRHYPHPPPPPPHHHHYHHASPNLVVLSDEEM